MMIDGQPLSSIKDEAQTNERLREKGRKLFPPQSRVREGAGQEGRVGRLLATICDSSMAAKSRAAIYVTSDVHVMQQTDLFPPAFQT